MDVLCFTTNMTSEQWAAWVQAIGSIVAIAVAIWISRREIRTEHRRRALETRNHKDRTYAEAILFCDIFLDSMEGMQKGCERGEDDLIQRHAFVIEDMLVWSHKIEFTVLAAAGADSLMRMRAAAVEAVALLKTDKPYAATLRQLDGLMLRLRKLRGKLVDAAVADGIMSPSRASSPSATPSPTS